MNIIDQLEREHIQELTSTRTIPAFQPGDTVRVNVKVVEGNRERIQAYEGVCIARKNAGLNSSFTVRKISSGEGVERIFPLYSPNIDSIDVIRPGRVRRAKLYYLRERRGRSARIAERTRGVKRPAKKGAAADPLANDAPASAADLSEEALTETAAEAVAQAETEAAEATAANETTSEETKQD